MSCEKEGMGVANCISFRCITNGCKTRPLPTRGSFALAPRSVSHLQMGTLRGWSHRGRLGPSLQAGPGLFFQTPGNGAMSTERVQPHEYKVGLLACHSWGGRSGEGLGQLFQNVLECSR